MGGKQRSWTSSFSVIRNSCAPTSAPRVLYYGDAADQLGRDRPDVGSQAPELKLELFDDVRCLCVS